MTWKILRLIVNTFTADEKYSLLNRDNVTQPIHIQLSQKQKTFSEVFFCFFESYIKVGSFGKKDEPHLMNFGNYRLQKTWLENCIKKPISENPSTSNMVNGPKHF